MPGTQRPSTLVLGLGNPLLGDDGVGLVVAAGVKARLRAEADVEVDVESCGGLRLMERIAGYRHLVLVDALCSAEAVPGSVWLLGPNDVPTWNAGSSHDITLPTALRLGQELGLAMPEDVGIVAVAAQDVFDFRESLCPAVAASVPLAVELVLRELAACVAKWNGDAGGTPGSGQEGT